MMDNAENAASSLRHKLRNAEAEKNALKGMLERASDEIEELVNSDCADEDKDHAEVAVRRFRRAARTEDN